MISPKDFLYKELKKLTDKFIQVECSYEFHNLTDAHYVEINPLKEFDKVAVQQGMISILSNFYDNFPGESLVFLNESDGIDLKPEFTVKGVGCRKNWSSILNNTYSNYATEPILMDEDCGYFYALAA